MEVCFEEIQYGDQLFSEPLIEMALVCPKCKHCYHPQLEAYIADNDEYEGREYGWNGRGQLIVTYMHCEGGCPPVRLLMGNHKGTCGFGIVKVDSRECVPDGLRIKNVRSVVAD
jgi:hypothetical protein